MRRVCALYAALAALMFLNQLAVALPIATGPIARYGLAFNSDSTRWDQINTECSATQQGTTVTLSAGCSSPINVGTLITWQAAATSVVSVVVMDATNIAAPTVDVSQSVPSATSVTISTGGITVSANAVRATTMSTVTLTSSVGVKTSAITFFGTPSQPQAALSSYYEAMLQLRIGIGGSSLGTINVYCTRVGRLVTAHFPTVLYTSTSASWGPNNWFLIELIKPSPYAASVDVTGVITLKVGASDAAWTSATVGAETWETGKTRISVFCGLRVNCPASSTLTGGAAISWMPFSLTWIA